MTAQRVLVVDDEASIRRLIAKVLETNGYVTEVAADGVEAIEKLATGTEYDLVVLDLMMPRVDGFGVLDHIKETQPELVRHVLVVSAFTQIAPDRIDPACRLLPKPFDLQQLLVSARECASPERAELPNGH